MPETYTGDEGDDALLAGMPIMDGSEDRRDGWLAINLTRDFIAQFFNNVKTWATTQLALKADKSQITTDGNVAEAGKAPIYNGAKQLTAAAPTLPDHVATKAYADAKGQLTDGGTFLRADGKNLGTTGDLFGAGAILSSLQPVVTNYVAMYWQRNDGDVGITPSSRRFKKDIKTWTPDRQALLALRVVTFHYKAALFGDDPARNDPPLEVGVIAEELHELGLTWLVVYDDDGVPLTVHYERIALALIPLIQDHEDRLAALEAGR